MRPIQYNLKPQDVVILLKIVAYGSEPWQQKPMAESLNMSQSEISHSLARLHYAGLLDESGKRVMRLALMDFLQFGLKYVFPQKPGSLVRGVLTAHSAPPLDKHIVSNENYVWLSATGNAKGYSIVPLYPSVVEAIRNDEKLYQLLALADALRVGRARERELAVKELKQRILNEK